MKKHLLLVLCFIFSAVLMARNDVDLSTFNKHMVDNMEQVLEDNPELYDKKNIGRKPASVNKFDADKTTEKLDSFEYQADSPKDW